MRNNKRKSQGLNGVDRLSDLPDGVLYHILSLMDTIHAVQTTILSRRWREVWKYVPVLNLHRRPNMTKLGFVQLVDQVLLRRSSYCNVRKITARTMLPTDLDVFDRLMKYAACRGLQELWLQFGYLKGRDSEPDYYDMFSTAIASVSACYQSLKVLELHIVFLNKAAVGSWSRLKLLETLTLESCAFDFGERGELHDPFAGFPRLETLKLENCIAVNEDPTAALKVSAPELLNLEIFVPRFVSVDVSAPKLHSFSFVDSSFDGMLPTGVCKFHLPSLNHASISLMKNRHMFSDTSCDENYKQLLLKQCVDLFPCMHNARSISFFLDTIELLTQACDMMKDQLPPFKRLKSLSLQHSDGPFGAPYQVIRYFLEGSHKKDKVFYN